MINMNFFNNVAAIILFVVLLGSCEGTAGDSADLTNSGKFNDPCLSEAMAERILMEEAKVGRLQRSLSLPGKIEVNNDRVFRVFPAAGGIISEVYVQAGDQVKKDQVLATVQSPDIAAFMKDMRHAIAEKAIAEQNLSLAKSMFESGVYSRRDLLEAQSELERINSEIARLKEEQMVLGIEDGQTFYTIRAPESGFIIERNINPGTTLRQNGSYVFKISDLQDVWVIANVSESDIGNIHPGDSVSITTLAYSDRIFTGEIVRLSSTIDPARRTMEAIIELPNPGFILKPGMFANIELNASEDETYIHIPSKALIFDENEYYVVIFNDRCDVEIKPITIKRINKDRVYLESGVNEGDKVVFSRHILVYNQLTSGQ